MMSICRISPPSAAEFKQVCLLSKKFDLDCQNMYPDQFLVAKKEDRLLGFGRIIKYPQFCELATLGVIPEERKKGIGSALSKKLIEIASGSLYAVCVIPEFFKKLGFKTTNDFPSIFEKKILFCHEYGFKRDEIFVMIYTSLLTI